VSDVAKVRFEASISREDRFSISAGKTTDFVWAVRLTKISKGILDKKWSYRVLTKGATFGVKEDQAQKEHVQQVLSEEGLSNVETIGSDDGDSVFVLST
jgi:hypothetical protein